MIQITWWHLKNTLQALVVISPIWKHYESCEMKHEMTLFHTMGPNGNVLFQTHVDTIDTVEGVCNGFLPYTRFLGFLEFSGYHQWQQESQ